MKIQTDWTVRSPDPKIRAVHILKASAMFLQKVGSAPSAAADVIRFECSCAGRIVCPTSPVRGSGRPEYGAPPLLRAVDDSSLRPVPAERGRVELRGAA